MHLVDLTTVGLHRLGLARSEVIDGDQVDYPITRQLSAWLYEINAGDSRIEVPFVAGIR